MFKVGDTGKTRGGDDYRVICVDAVGDYPVIALVARKSDVEFPASYKVGGNFYSDVVHDLDLIKTPVREVRYATVYGYDSFSRLIYTTQDRAIEAKGSWGGLKDRVLEVTFEDSKPVEARIVFVGDE